jgi:hypothetical protein
MNATKTMNDYPVFLRAFEGIGLLVLMAGFLALSWLLRREPLF